MMFSKFSLLVLVAIVALASATDYETYSAVSKARSAFSMGLTQSFFHSHFPLLLLLLYR
jgi:hypothetical protein